MVWVLVIFMYVNIKYIIFKVTVQKRTVFLLRIQVQLPHKNKELNEEIYHIDENERNIVVFLS